MHRAAECSAVQPKRHPTSMSAIRFPGWALTSSHLVCRALLVCSVRTNSDNGSYGKSDSR
jgi:hypothetical protein